jgi:hypothetical protein
MGRSQLGGAIGGLGSDAYPDGLAYGLSRNELALFPLGI